MTPPSPPTTMISPPHRYATTDDADVLARLVNDAGDGLPLYVWSKMASDGQDAWDVGRDRARREKGAFSCRNTVVREESGAVVAALVAYPLPAVPDPGAYDDLPALFVPLQQLEDLAPASFYINVLATLPAHRGRGFGSALLDIAAALGEAAGCSGLSLVVSDANPGARRLYERTGFVERARRRIVREDWEHDGEHWILMIRDR